MEDSVIESDGFETFEFIGMKTVEQKIGGEVGYRGIEDANGLRHCAVWYVEGSVQVGEYVPVHLPAHVGPIRVERTEHLGMARVRFTVESNPDDDVN